MDKLRKEIKKKFASLTVNQLGLIGYWFKLSRDLDFNYVNNKGRYSRNEYLKRIKEILKEVKHEEI
jgi:hypothetical protein|tara:strand:- start:197 stop:394 length:198 start_codon:yes stop_codon:yes gene_type:complete